MNRGKCTAQVVAPVRPQNTRERPRHSKTRCSGETMQLAGKGRNRCDPAPAARPGAIMVPTEPPLNQVCTAIPTRPTAIMMGDESTEPRHARRFQRESETDVAPVSCNCGM